ncbi:MAG: RNA polymerase sigma factor [Saprospiraceae bacterium]|nr:RNA polymerase sigma factor [Saprospiraceae bacterium]
MSANENKGQPPVEDQELLCLLRNEASRNEGFRQLVVCYQERLYWHIRRMVVSHDDANDVVQNTFLKVIRAIDGFKGDSKLYTWLYRIASNEALTFLKKRTKRMTDSVDSEALNLAERLQADPYFDGSGLQVKLKQAIERLPTKQKQVFVMRYYDEMSYQEISDVLGKSVGGLKASFHHAVKKIEDFVRTCD